MRSKVKLNEKSDKMSLNAINTSYYSVPRSCMCICFLSVSGIGSLLFCGFEMATDTHLQVCFIVSVKIITDIIGFIVWHPNLFNFFQLAAGGPKICVAGLVFPFFFFFLFGLPEKSHRKTAINIEKLLSFIKYIWKTESIFNPILFSTCEVETQKLSLCFHAHFYSILYLLSHTIMYSPPGAVLHPEPPMLCHFAIFFWEKK